MYSGSNADFFLCPSKIWSNLKSKHEKKSQQKQVCNFGVSKISQKMSHLLWPRTLPSTMVLPITGLGCEKWIKYLLHSISIKLTYSCSRFIFSFCFIIWSSFFFSIHLFLWPTQPQILSSKYLHQQPEAECPDFPQREKGLPVTAKPLYQWSGCAGRLMYSTADILKPPSSFTY